MSKEGRILAIHHQIFLAEMVAEKLNSEMVDLLGMMSQVGVKFATDEEQVMDDAFGVYSIERVKNELRLVKSDNSSKN
jgi:hypothetical protein